MIVPDYYSNFLKPKNLKHLAELFIKEECTLSQLIFGGINYSSETVKTKKGLEEIVQSIKPHFYELTKVEPLKDPKIYVKNKSSLINSLKLTLSDNVVLLASGLVSLVSGIASAMIGSPLVDSVGLGIGMSVSMTSAVCGMDMLFHGNALKRSTAFNLKNKIFLPYSDKDFVTSAAAHEYAHYARYKTKTDTSFMFLEDGLATAVSCKVLDRMPKSDKSYAIYNASIKLKAYATSSFAICLKNNLPLAISPRAMMEITHCLASFNYFGGLAMVMVAEKIYGKEVFEQVFKGKNEIFLI